MGSGNKTPMNLEGVKIRLETTYIRSRAWVGLLVTLGGIGIVLLGAYNMFAAPLLGMETFAPYRIFGVRQTSTDSGAYFLGDAIIMCVGAAIAWFS